MNRYLPEGDRGHHALIAVLVFAVLMGVGLIACGSDSGASTPEKIPVDHVAQFNEIQTTCDHGNRLYYQMGNGNGAAIGVAAHDPTCPQPETP